MLRYQRREKQERLTHRLVRLAGGIVTILAERKPGSTGLWIAALILLNVGVVPLIVADLGLTRLVYVLGPSPIIPSPPPPPKVVRKTH